MQTIRRHVRTDDKGVLHIDVPARANEEYDVLVVMQPVARATAAANGWPAGFFERMWGCMQDAPIQRWPQGEPDARPELA